MKESEMYTGTDFRFKAIDLNWYKVVCSIYRCDPIHARLVSTMQYGAHSLPSFSLY